MTEKTAYEQARELLAEALHLGMNGERAPGGEETWAEFYRKTELFLRGASRPAAYARVDQAYMNDTLAYARNCMGQYREDGGFVTNAALAYEELDNRIKGGAPLPEEWDKESNG